MPIAAQQALTPKEPEGATVVVIAVILALANFLSMLDTSIANVLVPHIAGDLGSSTSNGTWVITGYSVAEAIMVPLTGWLTERFGTVKVFTFCIIGFGAFSLACGLASSLPKLILFRVLLGMCGGPLIPISQILLIKLIPKRHSSAALATWAVTSIAAPVFGPVLGGMLSDHWSWSWAFYINVPLACLIAFLSWRVLLPRELPTRRTRMDFVGLGLLVLWVGALQIMLGSGQDRDWFHSSYIVVLLLISAVGFVSFVIWELTDEAPIINLSIYANRLFTVSQVVVVVAFGVVFGSTVLVPLWLQTNMGYTATWAGYNTALGGLTCVLAAPVASALLTRIDHRAVISLGLLFCAASGLMRISYNDQMTFWQLTWPQFLMGFGMILTLLPLIDMSTAALSERDIGSGAGQFNFARTLSGAIATAVIVALWNNQIAVNKVSLVNAMHNASPTLQVATNAGIPVERSRNLIDMLVQGQSVQQATNNTFLVVSLLMVVAAGIVWLARKPPKRSGERPLVH